MKALGVLAGLGLALVPVGAEAVVTPFATFSPTAGTVYNISYDGSSTGSTARTLYTSGNATADAIGSPSSVSVNFTFLQGGSSAPIAAVFSLKSISNGTALQSADQSLSQGGFSGSQPATGFSFTSTSGFTYNGKSYAAGTNLLTASFTNATLSSDQNSTAASFRDSTPGSDGFVRTVDYSSTVLDFSQSTNRSFSLNLDALAPPAHLANGSFASFSAAVGGTLSSDGLSSAVPEAGTWLMMLAGFAATGFGMRRNRRPVAA